MGQNRVSETRVASLWYSFVTGTTNYIVWILLLVTHFGQLLSCPAHERVSKNFLSCRKKKIIIIVDGYIPQTNSYNKILPNP